MRIDSRSVLAIVIVVAIVLVIVYLVNRGGL